MNAKLYFHGVPKGHQYEGEPFAETICRKFYDNQNKIAIKFNVELKKINNSAWCFYHYIAYRNPSDPKGDIRDYENRGGSYLGITLCIEGYYCRDALKMYRILDALFSSLVIGSLLEEKGSNLIWKISDLQGCREVLNKVDASFKQLFEPMPIEDFELIQNVPTGSNQTICYNLCSRSSELLDALKKTGAISISPFYPSDEMTVQRRHYEAELSKRQSQFEEMTKQKQKEISNKENEISTLNRQLSDARAISSKINELKDMLDKFGCGETSINQAPNSHQRSRRTSMLTILLISIAVALAINITISGVTLYKSQKVTVQEEATEQIDSDESEESESTESLIENNLSIDIEGYTKGNLSTGKLYTITIAGLDKLNDDVKSMVQLKCGDNESQPNESVKEGSYTLQLNAGQDSCHLFIEYNGTQFKERKFKVDNNNQ